ncbi:MAG: glycosyl transferase family 1, partial [Magnetovibrio sp.]|nr:glycosyl transferase family 1 [Magnetovibrio sp.]
GMASITILVGALVLSAVIGANRRAQQYNAVIFKVLGATRQRLLGVFLMEYGVLGLATALVGAFIGSVAAWAIVTFLMNMSWVFLPKTVALVALGCLLVALGVGFLGTWRVLGEKAAPHLRNQ